jgi:hypothetical protein
MLGEDDLSGRAALSVQPGQRAAATVASEARLVSKLPPWLALVSAGSFSPRQEQATWVPPGLSKRSPGV